MNRDSSTRGWGEQRFVKFSCENYSGLSLSDVNKAVLCDVGLPDWVAPNMCFNEKPVLVGSSLKIGEDRYDRDIGIELTSNNVVVILCDGETSKYVCESLLDLLNILLCYRYMVDDAILQVGRKAFLNNSIPNRLIDEFEEKVKEVDSYAVEIGTFWRDEIERLRSHIIDD